MKTTTKICTKCNKEKSLKYFSRDKAGKYGLASRCKECRIIISKEYRIKNKKDISERRKKFYKENSKRLIQEKRDYYNTESGRQIRRINNAKRRALSETTADGTITKESLQLLLNRQDNRCHECNEKLDFITPRKVHLDHHIPLSKGGTHSIENVVYLCQQCNMKKGSKMPTELLLI